METPPRSFCCEEDLERLGYDGWGADDDLAAWREEGLRPTTQELIDFLVEHDVTDATVLDIGAGVGMVHVSLLEAGAARAIDVDASRDYLDAARGEAERRGLAERIDYRYGDVVALAAGDPGLPEADVVTADSVICCYPYLPEFVQAATSVHPRLIGLTWPSDGWWSRAEMHALNVWWTLVRKHDRWFIHRRRDLDRLMREAGYEQVRWGGTRWWSVVLYERVAAARDVLI